MIALTLLVLIGLLWGVMEFIYGTILWYQRRKIRHNRRVEITQRHFAVARNELMRLALTGEVDVNSESFRRFYFLNTAMMRRPDQYQQFSYAITHMFLSDKGTEPSDELQRERKNWSPAFREAVKATASALDYIVLDYFWPIRVMYWLDRKQHPESTPIRMLSRTAERLEKKEKTVSEIRRTQKAMYMMASATL